MADRDGERVGGVVRRRRAMQPEEDPHHALHLRLLRPAVAADRLLHARRCVLDALDACDRRGDEHGTPRLSDGERGAGVGSDEGLLDGYGVRLVLRKELLHSLEDRQEALRRAVCRARLPAPVGELPEAPVACVDDAVSACRRPWIDAENPHGRSVRTVSDAASLAPWRSSTSPPPARAGPSGASKATT